MTLLLLLGWALFAGYVAFVYLFERWKRRNELPLDRNEALFLFELSAQLLMGISATVTGDDVMIGIVLVLTICPYLVLSRVYRQARSKRRRQNTTAGSA
jgi:hypothetical protein